MGTRKAYRCNTCLLLISAFVVALGFAFNGTPSATGMATAAAAERLPPQVMDAIGNRLDEIEVPVSKEVSIAYFIDYASPVHATLPGTDCGPNSNSFKTIKGGLRWKSFPVPYAISTEGLHQDVNADGIVDSTDSAAAKQAVANAFGTWDAENHPPGLMFAESLSPKIAVGWSFIDGPGGTLAIASVSHSAATKEIKGVSITYDSGDSWRVYGGLSCTSQGAAFDIEDIASHEIGHAIGLAHVSKAGDAALTMYPTAGQGETHKRTLGTGDKKGVDALY